MEKTGIAILGMGTVGTGVARILLDHDNRTARHVGRHLCLKHAVVKDLNRDREFALPAGVLKDDIQCVIDDPTVEIVAQLIGGVDDARDLMLKILNAGKNVVTANKALIAENGPELFEHARRLGRSIAFEASVCGGIPIVKAISQCLSANQIVSLRGILNGTSNFIVTKMDEDNADYHTVLSEAQQLGYAEADPAFDVDGSDAAQKLAILAQLAFGAKVRWREIPRRGIDSFDLADFRFARQMGYRVKLIALADMHDEGLQLSVAPMLTKIGSPLAEVRQNFNAVSIVGDAVGPLFFQGQGAGQMPTASAVVADLIDTAVGRSAITFQALALWSENSPDINIAAPGKLKGRYYLRFNVDDHPGVLAQIAGVLGENGISIASVIQHDSMDANQSGVPVVIMTQSATEQSAQDAMNQITEMPFVRSDFERVRILE